MPRKTKAQLRRSAAAVKGWETRREKQRQAETKSAARSAAARKGWETRRGGGRLIEEIEVGEFDTAAATHDWEATYDPIDYLDYDTEDEWVVEDPVIDTGEES